MELNINSIHDKQPLICFSMKIKEEADELGDIKVTSLECRFLPVFCHANIGFILYVFLGMLNKPMFYDLDGSHLMYVINHGWNETWIENVIDYSGAVK